jgi:hypothetical protein
MQDQTGTPSAASHGQETAEPLTELDAFCIQQATAREALGPEGRERLAEAYEKHGRKLDADPHVRAEREAAKLAREAYFASLNQGETLEVARQRAREACGRSELRFDYTNRAEKLWRDAVSECSTVRERMKHKAEGAVRSVRTQPRPRQRRETGGRRSSSGGGDSGSADGEPEPPPAGRLCRCGCEASIAHKAPQARYLNDTHAAADRQRRKRDRDNTPSDTDLGLGPVRCGCKPKRNPLEPGWCHQCGRPRDGVPVTWVPAGPRSKQLVMRDLARRKWRTGDGKRRPLTVIEGTTA